MLNRDLILRHLGPHPAAAEGALESRARVVRERFLEEVSLSSGQCF